jgi:hypothetical protein
MAESQESDAQGRLQRREFMKQYWEQTAERALQQLQVRLDALRSSSAQRMIEVEEWRADGQDLAVDTRAEGYYDVLDALPTDRADTELAELARRLEQLEQTQAMERSQQRAHGMSY